MAQRILGDYYIGETLGEGGFSKVKLGYHRDTNQKVALKILKKDKLSVNDSIRKQVEREINAMSKVVHPNVIQLFHVDWDSKYKKKNGKELEVILVVLELATGGELFEFLSFAGCFEENIARTYFHQLIEGIDACHSAGIAHRDLKPENLLLDGNFKLKLADFGFANVLGMMPMYTQCGTPGYMAPEMFGGKGYDAIMSDIWACGVILFIMLAGFPPFQRASDGDWWFNKLNTGRHHLFWAAHQRSAHFSDSVKDLLNNILMPDPKKRYTLNNIIKHEWYNGETLSDSDMESELSKKKVMVDEQKRRNVVHASGDDSMDEPMRRGIPFSDVPPAVPEFNKGDSVMINPEVEENKAEPEDYNKELKCYTNFKSKTKPSAILARISKLLTKSRIPHTVDENKFKVKGKFVSEQGTIQVHIQVYKFKDGQYICEFKRRKGDSMFFHKFFKDVMGNLMDLTIQ